MLTRRLLRPLLLIALTLFATLLAAGPAWAEEASLGGSSDISAGATVELTQGAAIPAIHHLFVDNPGAQSIQVRFKADGPSGVTITPEHDQLTIPPHQGETVNFSITLASALAPGDYPVTVQLMRSDIATTQGQVTDIPAIGTRFTVRVRGDAGTILVHAVSAQTGKPVEGTLTISGRTAQGSWFDLARTSATELRARVAPGDYRATYAVGGRELTSKVAHVDANQTVDVRLEVNSVAFVITDVRPVSEGGRIVVADLVASVENHLQAISGHTELRAVIRRGDQLIDTVGLQSLDQLPLGVTEGKATYRPADGFKNGTYSVTFELSAPGLELTSSGAKTITVSGGSSSHSRTTIISVAAASCAGLALVVATRRRRRPHRVPQSQRVYRRNRPTSHRARRRQRAHTQTEHRTQDPAQQP